MTIFVLVARRLQIMNKIGWIMVAGLWFYIYLYSCLEVSNEKAKERTDFRDSIVEDHDKA